MRERALFISTPDNLHLLTGEYRRIHFGDEFCERLLPGPAEVERVLNHAAEASCALTLVTPYVTEDGLGRVERLLEVLPDGTEVTINDWGVLRLLRRRFPGLQPVLGRLLTKIKRGPRISGFLDVIPPEALQHLRRTNLGVPAYLRFLADSGITRVELDNPFQGLDLSDVPEGLHLSLHIPFAYVTTTRFCLTANCDKPDRKGFIGVFPCGQECRKYTFYLDNAAMSTLLIRRGNTLFYKNTSLPQEIRDDPRIDRVVIAPVIPH